ncbi:2-C-methyl-D-erythritol 4-phosphate cytidylyltransferase [Mycolicibacterium rutilum]|uniref:2-C-methyl-D-erythritol 4-phosphate cytidylyltransferase n=1 Tax=Mycolicibacterium rutilum TaxID=370526 RepID=A0A1H6KAT8_MYCRU|nr:2-C-methyl-D-erythritol 4-phosphate cytidylyltransferase [Mycolicibacterium rutilum]SEH72586.1 2-C-methyl-D-erythritol 4-phosphate cytidylyltransferase [Mycolicibacterium rutilum]
MAPTPLLPAIVPVPTEAADAARYLLDGRATLLRVVRDLLESVSDPTAVVVVSAPSSVRAIGDLLAADGLGAIPVVAADAPADRMRCLAAGFEYVAAQPVSPRYLLVHDVRQPLTSAAVRERVVAELVGGAAVVLPLLPVTDSVKAVDASDAVTATLDRSTLRAVQYPRGFAADALARLVASGEADELTAATRSAMPITTVEGDADGFIADLPRDAAFVEAVMASRRG